MIVFFKCVHSVQNGSQRIYCTYKSQAADRAWINRPQRAIFMESLKCIWLWFLNCINNNLLHMSSMRMAFYCFTECHSVRHLSCSSQQTWEENSRGFKCWHWSLLLEIKSWSCRGRKGCCRDTSILFTVFSTTVIVRVQIGFGHASPQRETVCHHFFCLVGGKTRAKYIRNFLVEKRQD